MSILDTKIADLPREELFIGPAAVRTLAAWAIVTVEDLTRVGWMEECPLQEEDWIDCKWGPQTYLPALIDLRGFGPVRIQRIRTFLTRHGLALTDEAWIAERIRQGYTVGD